MYVARSLCTLKILNKVKLHSGYWLMVMNLSHSPIDINHKSRDSMRQLEYVCVDGTATKHSDWRLEFGEDKRSRRQGARLNKKSVRKRRLTSNAKFSLKNWKWQVLRKYEMPKECWHATIQKHLNKSVSLNPYQCFVGLLTTSLHGFFLT